MKFLTLCPYVHRPSYDAMLATMGERMAAELVPIDNRMHNLGIAASRNIGALLARDRGLDWVVEVSPVTRFGPTGGDDFLAYLELYPDRWVMQSATPVNWHCIAWNRTLFERVGLFDENFWPVYGEDGDMSRRIHIAAEDDGREGVWGCVEIDAWITMHGHAQKLAGVKVNHDKIWAYYARKHGGRSGDEQVRRPFGDRRKGLDFWPMPPDPRSIYDEIREVADVPPE